MHFVIYWKCHACINMLRFNDLYTNGLTTFWNHPSTNNLNWSLVSFQIYILQMSLVYMGVSNKDDMLHYVTNCFCLLKNIVVLNIFYIKKRTGLMYKTILLMQQTHTYIYTGALYEHLRKYKWLYIFIIKYILYKC